MQIAETIYLYKDNSTMAKINALKKLFTECGLNEDLLQFEIYLQNAVD